MTKRTETIERVVRKGLLAPSGEPICCCRNTSAVKAGMERACWYCELREALAKPEETCHWTQDIDGNWRAACGVDFILIEGTPFDNSMKYCCGCGKKLEVIVYTEPEDEEDEQKE